MNKNYSYPLDLSWSTERLASVLSFFLIRLNKPMNKRQMPRIYLEAYKAFKKVVPKYWRRKASGKGV